MNDFTITLELTAINDCPRVLLAALVEEAVRGYVLRPPNKNIAGANVVPDLVEVVDVQPGHTNKPRYIGESQ